MSWLVKIPLLVTAIGVMIHALGLLDFIPHPNIITDLSMFVIDLVVIYGLVRKTRWGYNLSCFLYLQQTIMQPYWAYYKYRENFFVVHFLEIFLAPLFVMSTFCILILNKRYFVR